MVKKLTSLLLALTVGGMTLVGCGTQEEVNQVKEPSVEKTGDQPEKETEQTESEQAETITITDQLGRQVEIPKKVERIVSSYYITSSLLIALGAEDRVVGVEMKADTREIYKKAAPQFLDLPGIGTAKTINVEEVLALNPDVVIMPYRLKEFIPQFEALNIPVIAVEPESFENFLECVELVGTAIGEEERAKDLVTYYRTNVEEVKTLTENVEERPKVYLSGGSSYLTTCTSNMYQNDMIEIAGGENVSKELQDGYWANVSVEQILMWNPDVIYSVGYASYGLADVTGDAKLAGVEAIKNGNVGLFPSILEPWDYPTPSSILGILWLVNQLHPELYSIEQYTEEAENFYETFFDIEVTPEEMGL
ncbi:MAG: ABC transporter substrate-binding protein [Cellulosilyticaceae bacterium]